MNTSGGLERVRSAVGRAATWPWPDVVLILVLATAAPVVAPIVGNQNQYLAHVLADRGTPLDADWFVGTTDPYPFFTALARAAYDVSGLVGIRFLAWLATAVSLVGVYGLARVLAPPARKRWTAIAATVLVAALIAPILSKLPIPWVNQFSAFSGMAGQYLGGYLQPSVFGCLLLAAFPLWLVARRAPAGARVPPTLAALALTALGCMLHPTYLVAVAVGLGAALIADAWKRNFARVGWYVLIGAVVVAAALVANPALLAIGGASVESSEAMQRFAFERIPHHTLWTNWPRIDLLYVVVIALAAWSLWRRGTDGWLARWLASGLVLALAGALLVGLTESSTLALLFPWRISVFLVPIATTVLAVAMAAAAGRVVSRLLSGSARGRVIASAGWPIGLAAALAAVAVAGAGLVTTAWSVPPSSSDEAVALVRASNVEGVGLIPLDEQNVRLNAGVPIYVDWKSPPYASTDLVEWWSRIDQVRDFERNAETFCAAGWGDGIGWILVHEGRETPSCVADWEAAGESDAWRVLRRP
ncbi:DUF6798 domain-containing protein [Agromyces bauzanensis]